MTQQDINIFLALVEKRNLSKAASALYMSQSTLSHRLNMLEKELNATLFTRQKGHRTLELTPFGHDFIHIGRAMDRPVGRDPGASHHAWKPLLLCRLCSQPDPVPVSRASPENISEKLGANPFNDKIHAVCRPLSGPGKP